MTGAGVEPTPDPGTLSMIMSNENPNTFAFQRIYDEFRTVEMNKEYYSVKIAKTKRVTTFIDIFLAVFAGGSGVMSFALWNYQFLGVEIGQIALGTLVGIAIMIGIGKPYLKYDDKIERYAKMQGLYRSLAHSLKDIVDQIRVKHAVTQIENDKFDLLRNTRGHFAIEEDETTDRELVKKMQEIVNRRYPLSYFFYPKSRNAPTEKEDAHHTNRISRPV